MWEMESFRERYPPPWRIERTRSGYRVAANNDTSLPYIYAEEGWAIDQLQQAELPRSASLGHRHCKAAGHACQILTENYIGAVMRKFILPSHPVYKTAPPTSKGLAARNQV